MLKNFEVSNVLGDSGGVEKSSEPISKNVGESDDSVNISETKDGKVDVLDVVSCSNCRLMLNPLPSSTLLVGRSFS